MSDVMSIYDFRSALTADIEATTNINSPEAGALKFLRSVEVTQAEIVDNASYDQKTLRQNATVMNRMRALVGTGSTSIISGLAELEKTYGEDDNYQLGDTGLEMAGHTSLEGRKWLVFTDLVERIYDSRQAHSD